MAHVRQAQSRYDYHHPEQRAVGPPPEETAHVAERWARRVFAIALIGCATAWLTIELITHWAGSSPYTGTPAYNDAVEAHGVFGYVVGYSNLVGCAVGTIAGLASVLTSLGFRSWGARIGMAILSLIVAFASLIPFGAWI